MRQHETEFERDDGTIVFVSYTISPVYPATYWEPAEGGEVEIVSAKGEDGNPVVWTDAEDDKWCSWIGENHDFNEDDYYD